MGREKARNLVPSRGIFPFLCFMFHKTVLFVCVYLLFFLPSLSWLKLRRLIELFVFVFRTAWAWECFPFVGIK